MRAVEGSLANIVRLNIVFSNLNKDAERRTGLSVVQWCLLNRILVMPVSSAQRLAHAMGMHPSTLTQSLKLLSKKGYVFVAQDPRDSRRKLISLTRKGFEAIGECRAQMAAYEEKLGVVSRKLESVRMHLASITE